MNYCYYIYCKLLDIGKSLICSLSNLQCRIKVFEFPHFFFLPKNPKFLKIDSKNPKIYPKKFSQIKTQKNFHDWQLWLLPT